MHDPFVGFCADSLYADDWAPNALATIAHPPTAPRQAVAPMADFHALAAAMQLDPSRDHHQLGVEHGHMDLAMINSDMFIDAVMFDGPAAANGALTSVNPLFYEIPAEPIGVESDFVADLNRALRKVSSNGGMSDTTVFEPFSDDVNLFSGVETGFDAMPETAMMTGAEACDAAEDDAYEMDSFSDTTTITDVGVGDRDRGGTEMNTFEFPHAGVVECGGKTPTGTLSGVKAEGDGDDCDEDHDHSFLSYTFGAGGAAGHLQQ
ncbi:hypothetical protein HK101_010334 [Irineochytrium annulatum]|nr:hypothetical protein HK101_010334 [Irineochytrium annulatum]